MFICFLKIIEMLLLPLPSLPFPPTQDMQQDRLRGWAAEVPIDDYFWKACLAKLQRKPIYIRWYFVSRWRVRFPQSTIEIGANVTALPVTSHCLRSLTVLLGLKIFPPVSSPPLSQCALLGMW